MLKRILKLFRKPVRRAGPRVKISLQIGENT